MEVGNVEKENKKKGWATQKETVNQKTNGDTDPHELQIRRNG